MPLLLGILAAVLGAEAPVGPNLEPIRYRVRFLDMEGLDWRGTYYAKLQQIACQKGATVWTTPAEVAQGLVEKAVRVTHDSRVVASVRSPAHVVESLNRQVVTGIDRVADGPVDHASFLGIVPKLTATSEGVSATFTGRKIDQGVLTCVVIDDKQVTSLHPVRIAEHLEPSGTPVGDTRTLGATIQVPEVSHCEVTGEWLIPNGEVLLVSLGVHTVADAKGMAVVRERLAVVEAVDTAAPRQIGHVAIGASGFMPTSISRTAGLDEYAIPMPHPSVPTRSLPQGVNASGEPVALPPLPEGTPLTTLPGTPDPCATPQIRAASVPGALVAGLDSKLDVGTVKASATEASECPAELEVCQTEKAASRSAWAPATPRTFRFRLPIRGGIDLEIRAVANTASHTEATPD